jgi:hypothetical protein
MLRDIEVAASQLTQQALSLQSATAPRVVKELSCQFGRQSKRKAKTKHQHHDAERQRFYFAVLPVKNEL